MMNSSAKLIFVCSLLLISCVEDVWGRTHVIINNSLPAGTTLTAHCKSKDDDLGIHYITSSWEFQFRPSLFGNTLYFCSFAWPNNFHWFDIYVQSRDSDHCTTCSWKIFPTGPCRFNEKTTQYDVCLPWNPTTKLGRKPLM
ncbi:hypothetical protein ACJRO7_026346 [Eucalyptus globulus]|uniref:S-protein homolog n=1 Tax=Eucalyptus globulus TaxID=34317 RepID=A0ABD3JN37_EUCGL